MIVEIPDELLIVFKNGDWLKRRYYDGSEWWRYEETPKAKNIKIELITNLTDVDLGYGDEKNKSGYKVVE